ncbi:hypothetical protein WOLCODRAFT_162903 [Wolfiporia cocos MD-104 SS10]|uniref:Uncharacterized protein n=1 Tax=Wolfiporia cocos (strain MD-104) TaxID=742152 RepID=A0A2H3JTR2_WOLCO|nr:hypothetical protein WOLCODRAFT_162903 [Wolfiporia cocos MD-104 SS10]
MPIGVKSVSRETISELVLSAGDILALQLTRSVHRGQCGQSGPFLAIIRYHTDKRPRYAETPPSDNPEQNRWHYQHAVLALPASCPYRLKADAHASLRPMCTHTRATQTGVRLVSSATSASRSDEARKRVCPPLLTFGPLTLVSPHRRAGLPSRQAVCVYARPSRCGLARGGAAGQCHILRATLDAVAVLHVGSSGTPDALALAHMTPRRSAPARPARSGVSLGSPPWECAPRVVAVHSHLRTRAPRFVIAPAALLPAPSVHATQIVNDEGQPRSPKAAGALSAPRCKQREPAARAAAVSSPWMMIDRTVRAAGRGRALASASAHPHAGHRRRAGGLAATPSAVRSVTREGHPKRLFQPACNVAFDPRLFSDPGAVDWNAIVLKRITTSR